MIYVGDVGTRLQLQFVDYEYQDGVKIEIGPINVSGENVSEIFFYFQKPDGTSATPKTLTAAEVVRLQDTGDDAPGESGIAYYDTEDGFLDQPGKWRLQGCIELPGGRTYNASIVTFQVEAPLPR